MNCAEVNNNLLTKIYNKATELVNKGSWPNDRKILVKINKIASVTIIVDRIKDHKAGMPIR